MTPPSRAYNGDIYGLKNIDRTLDVLLVVKAWPWFEPSDWVEQLFAAKIYEYWQYWELAPKMLALMADIGKGRVAAAMVDGKSTLVRIQALENGNLFQWVVDIDERY